MRRLLANPAILVTLVAGIVWAILVAFAPVDPLNYVLRIGIFTVCLITLLRWGKAGFRVYLEGARDPEDAAILAVVLTAVSYIWYVGWTAISRYLDGPDWMMNSPWSAFFAYLALISFVLAIASTRLRGESPSTMIAFVLAAGTALGLAATAAGHFLVAKAAFFLGVLFHILPK